MSVKHTNVGWRFFALWLLATAGGWTAGLSILGLIPAASADPLVEGGVIAAAGALAGLLQWLLLRRYVARAGWWPAATAAGWAVGLALAGPFVAACIWMLEAMHVITRELAGVSLGTGLGLLFGALVGGSQWLVLRRQVRRAGTWVSASVAAWTAGLALFSLIPETTQATFIGGVLLIGLVAGAITGGLLTLLLRPPSTRFVGLRIRLVASFSLLFAVSLLGAFFWFYNHSMNAALVERIQEIETILRVAPAGVDGDGLAALGERGLRPDDLADGPRTRAQLDWLETVRGERPYALYTLVRTAEPGEVAFVVDTSAAEGCPEAAQPGETRSPAAGDPAWDGFSTAVVIGAEDVFSFSGVLDEVLWKWPAAPETGREGWLETRGSRFSGLAPIHDAHGETVGVLGVDLQESYVAQVRAGILEAMARSFGDVLGILIILALLVARSITRPITELTEAARRIGRGEFEQDLSHVRDTSFFHHEIDELAEAIEESGRAHLSERRLRRQVEELKIQIDEVRRRRQVAEIVEDDFFQDLQARAGHMRAKRQGEGEPDQDPET